MPTRARTESCSTAIICLISTFLITTMGIATLFPVCSQDEPSAKLPVPDIAAIEAARKVVNERFNVDRVKSSKDRMRIEREVREILKTGNDHALEYVLRKRKPNLKGIREIEARFDVDGLALKCDFLAGYFGMAVLPPVFAEEVLLSDLCETVNQAIALDRFATAREIAEAFDKAIKPTKQKDAKRISQDLLTRTREVEREYRLRSAVFARLNPDDTNSADALEAGKFRCFIQRNWDVGLPLLSRGNAPELATVAALDRLNPTNADERKQVADKWHDFSKTTTGAAQDQSRRRALYWYRSAASVADAEQAALLNERIDELNRQIPLEPYPWSAMGRWTFEESTWQPGKKTLVKDPARGKVPAEIIGASLADGKVGKGVSLDSQDQVKMASGLTNDLTICFWVSIRNWPLNGEGVKIVSNDFGGDEYGGYVLVLRPEYAEFIIADLTDRIACRTKKIARFETDTWYHLTATCDNISMKLYINGQLDSTSPQLKIAYLGSQMIFGNNEKCIEPNGLIGIDGIIDEVASFDRALTADEVDNLYRMGAVGNSLAK